MWHQYTLNSRMGEREHAPVVSEKTAQIQKNETTSKKKPFWRDERGGVKSDKFAMGCGAVIGAVIGGVASATLLQADPFFCVIGALMLGFFGSYIGWSTTLPNIPGEQFDAKILGKPYKGNKGSDAEKKRHYDDLNQEIEQHHHLH